MSALVLGIDVAKDELVIACRPSLEQWTTPNTPVGLEALVDRIRALNPQSIVLERRVATSGPVPCRWRWRRRREPAAGP